MFITFSIYGEGFDAYNFLLDAKELPKDVKLWDDGTFDEELGTEGGFTLEFIRSREVIALPFSLGKFLLSNLALLNSEKYFKKGIYKSISVMIEHEDLKRLSRKEMPVIYIVNPPLLKFFAELDICLYVTKLGAE